MAKNILPPSWSDLDSHEIRLLLKERIGGHGQYDTEITGSTVIHIPAAREQCKLSLKYRDGRITTISTGPAFDKAEWQQIVAEVDTTFRNGTDVSMRAIAFSSFRVPGAWRSTRSGIRILPAPESAPDTELEIAEHPFVLEYTYKSVASQAVSQYRATIALQRVTLLLNVLLIGRTCLQPAATSASWAMRWENDAPRFEWLQQSYFASLAEYPATLSVLESHAQLTEVPDSAYYGVIGHDGKGLRVPESLDDSLARFFALDASSAERITRALYWFDVAQRTYSLSTSVSFAALVSSIEALTDRGNAHTIACPECGQTMTHETPGATKRFQEVVERHAGGASTKNSRDLIYRLRSNVLHGSALMQVDQLKYVGWDPPEWNEFTIHRHLWDLTSRVVRGWLAEIGGTRPPNPNTVHLDRFRRRLVNTCTR